MSAKNITKETTKENDNCVVLYTSGGLDYTKDKLVFEKISKENFYNKLCDIFNLHIVGKKLVRGTHKTQVDENGIPNYFPYRVKDLINDLYCLYQSICSLPQNFDFVVLSDDSKSDDLTYSNRALIFTKIMLGKLQSGKDITSTLFDGVSQETDIPQSFKNLCRIKNNKYKISNTDYKSQIFQLAVLDLIKLQPPKIHQQFQIKLQGMILANHQ